MIRALIIATIEYLFMIYVLKKGKNFKYIICTILFFLATYQLGEFLTFLKTPNDFGIRLAYFSTTLLPPLGILLLEKITRKKYFYQILQIIGIIFALVVFVSPSSLIVSYTLTDMCVRIDSYTYPFGWIWGIYYQAVLIFTMVLLIFNILFLKGVNKKLLKLVLLAYISFDFTAIIIIWLFPSLANSLASLMCALALFAAFVLTRISVNKRLLVK